MTCLDSTTCINIPNRHSVNMNAKTLTHEPRFLVAKYVVSREHASHRTAVLHVHSYNSATDVCYNTKNTFVNFTKTICRLGLITIQPLKTWCNCVSVKLNYLWSENTSNALNSFSQRATSNTDKKTKTYRCLFRWTPFNERNKEYKTKIRQGGYS